MTLFLAIVALMTLAAVGVVAVPLLGSREGRAPVAAVVAALAIPGAVLFLYATQSSYSWDRAPSDSAAIEALRARAAASPADRAAWVALAEGLITEQRYADARDAYAQALRTGNPEDDALRLAYAEATVLADRNALAGEAAEIIEAVLARDPVNAKALWYGGMVALGRGDTAVARDRWTRLLALEPPPQVRQIIAEQVARLDADAGSPAPGDAGARIPLRVSVDPALAPRIQPGATLFLFARAGEGGGPPLAVARRDAAGLPIDTELSDADSMVPGRSLAGAGEVRVTARVANDGEALAAPGDVYGEALWRPGQGLVEIRMDRLVQ